MKCVVTQNGFVQLMDMDEPQLRERFVLVETEFSAISIGTELGLIHNPAVSKPHPLGYSAAGTVIAVGDDVPDFHAGDKVACYGGPYVVHAERLAVPRNLCVKVPPQVPLREAAFVGLGAIAIHSVRRAALQFGESVVVMGLGLLGQLIAQLCHEANYQVIATDTREDRCEAARKSGIPHVVNVSTSGAEAVSELARQISDGAGVDAVVISAHAATPVIDQALGWIAPRGKVIVVGNIPMEFSREAFFQKEADLLIARAAGPGRYDPIYERDGIDYPRAYVRWTEGRNLQEYMRQIRDGRLRIGPLITHEFPFGEAPAAYRVIEETPELLAAVFTYSV